jgi:hypothetical protein
MKINPQVQQGITTGLHSPDQKDKKHGQLGPINELFKQRGVWHLACLSFCELHLLHQFSFKKRLVLENNY